MSGAYEFQPAPAEAPVPGLGASSEGLGLQTWNPFYRAYLPSGNTAQKDEHSQVVNRNLAVDLTAQGLQQHNDRSSGLELPGRHYGVPHELPANCDRDSHINQLVAIAAPNPMLRRSGNRTSNPPDKGKGHKHSPALYQPDGKAHARRERRASELLFLGSWASLESSFESSSESEGSDENRFRPRFHRPRGAMSSRPSAPDEATSAGPSWFRSSFKVLQEMLGYAPDAGNRTKNSVASLVEEAAERILSEPGASSIQPALRLALGACNILDHAATSNSESWETLSKALARLILALGAKVDLGKADRSGRFENGIIDYIHEHYTETLHQVRLAIRKTQFPREGPKDWSDFEQRRAPKDRMSEPESRQLCQEEAQPTVGPPSAAPEMPNEVYKWFIARSLNSLLLHHDDAASFHSFRGTRRFILRILMAGGWINNYRATTPRNATFYLPFAFTHRLGDKAVVTASDSQHMQATTVRRYLDQTWPFVGSGTFDFLMNHSRMNSSGSSSTVLPNGVEIEAIKSANLLAISASGAPHFIAELGEQLAWLLAATVPASNSAVYSATRIQHQHVKTWVTGPSRKHCHWHLEVENRGLTQANPNLRLLTQIKLLGPLLGSVSPVIEGFPTAWRPDHCPGIEVSFEILHDFVGVEKLEVTDTFVHVIGRNVRLKLIRGSRGVLVWHVLFPASHCLCSPQPPSASEVSWFAIGLPSLYRYRHIVSLCIDTQSSTEDGTPTTLRTDQGGRTRNRWRFHRLPKAPSPASATHRKRRLPEHTSYSSDDESLGQLSMIDTDVLSMSDSSDDVLDQIQNLGNELSPLVDAVARRLLRGYQRAATSLPIRKCTTSGSPGTAVAALDTTSRSPLRPFNPPGRSGGSHKRGHGEDEEDGNSDGESRRWPPKRPKPADPTDGRSTKFLACPFWKLDPSEHRNCFRLTLDGIARVKQHLSRKHAPQFYCEFCLAVFPDKDTHQAHIRSRSCAYRSCTFTGITHQQRRELSRRSRPNSSEPDRWFAIWDIVFPDRVRPTSPYMDSDLSEDLCRFREFAQFHGPRMIAADIQALGLGTEDARQPAVLEAAISRGLLTLFETWLAERPLPTQQIETPTDSPSFSRGQSSSDTAQSIQQGTPASSVPPVRGQQGGEGLCPQNPAGDDQMNMGNQNWEIDFAYPPDHWFTEIDLATPNALDDYMGGAEGGA